MKNIYSSITFATLGLGFSLALIVQSSAQALDFDFSLNEDSNLVAGTIYSLNDAVTKGATSVKESSYVEQTDLELFPFTNEFTGASESIESYNFRLSYLWQTLFAMIINKQHFLVL